MIISQSSSLIKLLLPQLLTPLYSVLLLKRFYLGLVAISKTLGLCLQESVIFFEVWLVVPSFAFLYESGEGGGGGV